MNASIHLNGDTKVDPRLVESQHIESIKSRAWLTVLNMHKTKDWRYAREEVDLWFDDEVALDNLIAGLQEIKEMRRKELNREQEHIDAIESTASVC